MGVYLLPNISGGNKPNSRPPLQANMSGCFGHDAVDHEQLLYGVELDNLKADCREHPKWALKPYRFRG